MTNRKIPIERITLRSFASFGKIIELPRRNFPSPGENLWKIIVRQRGTGWRIAYLVVRDRSLKRLERHPGSLESFEPVAGKSLLFVASRRDERRIRCFSLDRPVILKKGLWHGIVTVSRESDVKITENSKVACSYWPLGFELHG